MDCWNPAQQDKEGLYFFRILDMKYYNYNSKFLVQRSSKMGPSVQKYMNFDDFMS